MLAGSTIGLDVIKMYDKKIYNKKYYEENKEKIKTGNAFYKKEYSKTLRGRYLKTKQSAKQRNLIFELTQEEYEKYFYKNLCFYCGRVSTGIDRVDSNKPYIEGNMLPCCDVCNFMKQASSFEDFIDQINRIYRRLS